MINLATIYGTRVLASEAFPQGAAKNESAEGANDGLYPDKAWVNDIFGFMQAAIKQSKSVISDSGETADDSDVLDAILKLASVVKFPTTSGKLNNKTDATWAIIDDNNATPVNLATIDHILADDGDEKIGDVKLTQTRDYNTTHSFIASMSKELAKLGMTIGVDSKTGSILCSMASSFGIRALLTYSGGGVWTQSTDAGFSSKDASGNSLTLNALDSNTSVTVLWDTASIKYLKTNKNWVVTKCVNQTDSAIGDGVEAVIDQSRAYDYAVKLRFRANTPVTATFNISVPGGGSYGIVTYSFSAGVLTITHSKRSGKAIVTAISSPNIFVVEHVSETQKKVRCYGNDGIQKLVNTDFNFNLMIPQGPSDFVEPPVGTTISISNGTGARPQDASSIEAEFNLFGVGEVLLSSL